MTDAVRRTFFCVGHKQCSLQVSFQPFQGRGSPRREQPDCAGGHCVGHRGHRSSCIYSK